MKTSSEMPSANSYQPHTQSSGANRAHAFASQSHKAPTSTQQTNISSDRIPYQQNHTQAPQPQFISPSPTPPSSGYETDEIETKAIETSNFDLFVKPDVNEDKGVFVDLTEHRILDIPGPLGNMLMDEEYQATARSQHAPADVMKFFKKKAKVELTLGSTTRDFYKKSWLKMLFDSGLAPFKQSTYYLIFLTSAKSESPFSSKAPLCSKRNPSHQGRKDDEANRTRSFSFRNFSLSIKRSNCNSERPNRINRGHHSFLRD